MSPGSRGKDRRTEQTMDELRQAEQRFQESGGQQASDQAANVVRRTQRRLFRARRRGSS